MVFFDLDGTLLRGLSAEVRFLPVLLGRRMLGPTQLAAYLNFPVRWFTQYRIGVLRRNKAYLAGLRVGEVECMARAFVRQVLLLKLRPSVTGRLHDHLARGENVVLLTGAPTFIAEPIAASLGITQTAATLFGTHNGFFTSCPPPIRPLGIEKLRIAREMCRYFKTTLADCYAYADSASDIPLMASVSRPIAVHPDRKLRRHAKRHGWQIVER